MRPSATLNRIIDSIMETASSTKKSFYKQIDGVQYSRRLLDWADEAVAGRGDGRVSASDAEELFDLLASDNRYSDLEKRTIKYIREHHNWTELGDAYLRGAVRSWAATRGANK